MLNKIFILIFFTTIILAGCGGGKTKGSAESSYAQALAAMQKKSFNEARKYMTQALKVDPDNPKYNYAIAVCYLRKTPPDVANAAAYRVRAQRLGFIIPEWFDNYLKIAASSKHKSKK